VRDITERKRADEALRESEEHFRQLTENIQEVFWMTSTDKSKMLYVSPAYEEVWGRTRASLYENPRSFLEAIHPDDRERVIMSQREQIQKGYKLQYRIVRPDGLIRWIRDRAFPIRNEIGGIYRIAGIAEDITKRKEVEEKILNYQKQLQSLASELSLAEERERRRIALWLHDQIGQTLAISRIKLGSLQESLPSTESCEVINEVRLLIEQTIQSVRSLTFELSPPILYELGLEAALEWLTEKFQDQHGIQFEFEDDFKPKPLENDIRVLLFQAVRELLVNVAKHSQAHKTKVSIGSDGDYVRIKVEDDGIGLELSKVGPPWDKACGFGLFSIRERLIPLGGDLEIKSEAGRGTRITLRAPKKQEKQLIMEK
ncbi:MAG: PAS domain-containing protein, partial [Anaerolineae bacterium]|nr:PAS domain-containing protein [Anaerolineae bacterium]